MSYCKKTGEDTTVPTNCLACKHCLPPSKRIGGRMCEYEEYDFDGTPTQLTLF